MKSDGLTCMVDKYVLTETRWQDGGHLQALEIVHMAESGVRILHCDAIRPNFDYCVTIWYGLRTLILGKECNI